MISIDLNLTPLYELAQHHPLYIAWIIFLYGGWIPVLGVLIWGFSELWLYWRQGLYAKTLRYTLLAIDIPKGNEQTPKPVEHIFSHLSGARSSITLKEKWWEGRFHPNLSLEIISMEGHIQFLVRTPTKFYDLVEAAFYAQYPNAEIVEVEDYMKSLSKEYPNEFYDWFGGETILKNKSCFPIRTYPQFEYPLTGEFKDPMSGLLESISRMGAGEMFFMQFLIVPADDKWKDEGEKVVNKILGRKIEQKKTLLQEAFGIPGKTVADITDYLLGQQAMMEKPAREELPLKMLALTPRERQVIEAIQFKTSKVGFVSKIRWIYYAKKEVFKINKIYYPLKGIFKQFSALDLNSFGSYGPTLTKADYFWQKWSLPRKKREIIRAFASRDMTIGAPLYIFNIEELATLYHFPMLDVKAPMTKKAESRRGEPPSRLPTKAASYI